MEGEYMQLVRLGLIIYVCEGGKLIGHPHRKRHEQPAFCSLLGKVVVGLGIDPRTHVLYLEVHHVVDAFRSLALVVPLATEGKFQKLAALRKFRLGFGGNFYQGEFVAVKANNVAAAGHPYLGLVAVFDNVVVVVYVKQLRVQWPVVQEKPEC